MTDRLLYRWQRFTWAWARACWFVSRQLGGRSVFGKRDLTPRKRIVVRLEPPAVTPSKPARIPIIRGDDG